MRIGDFEINGGAALAHMAGVADRAFREICIEFGGVCRHRDGQLKGAYNAR